MLALPALVLAPSLFGTRTLVPFDVAAFAPTATMLTAEEHARVTEAANLDPTELVMVFLPEMRLAGEEVAAGRLPLWNPHARFGTALHASTASGVGCPQNWLRFAFDDPRDSLALGMWLLMAIAGLLMFGLLRAAGLGAAGATLGAVAYSMSGTLVAQGYFYPRCGVIAWTPGLLWGVWAVFAGRAAAVCGLSIAVAMVWLSCYPQIGAPALLASGVFAAALAVGRVRARAAVLRPLLLCAGAVLLGTGLAAYLLLPMLGFFPESCRGAVPSDESIASVSIGIEGLLGWLMPTLFGPTSSVELPFERSPMSLWLLSRVPWSGEGPPMPSGWNFVEGTVYAGVLSVPLALFAASWPRRKIERCAVAVLLVTVALGGGYRWLAWFHTIPGVNQIMPTRFALLACVALAVLAACGFDRLLRECRGLRGRVFEVSIYGVAGAAIIAWLWLRSMPSQTFAELVSENIFERHAGRLPDDMTVAGLAAYLVGPDGRVGAAGHALVVGNLLRLGAVMLAVGLWWSCARRAAGSEWAAQLWRAVAVVGLAIELGSLAYSFLPGRELPVQHGVTPVHRFLREENERFAAEGGYAAVRAAPAEIGPTMPFAMPPGELVACGVRDLNAYAIVDGESQRPFAKIWGDAILHEDKWPVALPDDERLAHPFLDLAGVRWVLSEHALEHAGRRVGPELRGSRTHPDGTPVEFFIYERDTALPRAFVVPGLDVVDDLDAAAARLAAADFDPRRRAVVVRGDAESAQLANDLAAAPFTRSLRFVEDLPTSVQIEVEAGAAGWLVLRDAWLSGWSARVDQRSVDMLRANVAMRALRLPESACRVEFTYAAPYFVAGVSVSLLSGLVFCALLWLALRRRARTPPTAL